MTDEEIIRWFRHTESPGEPKCFGELASIKFPEQIQQDIDRAYISGVMDCADMFLSMYRKGYVRATETHNVLMRWMATRTKCGWRLLSDEHEVIGTWFDVRRKVLARDNHKCTICGSDEKIEVHHIVSVRDGGMMDFGNLAAVCFKCHRERKDEATDKNKAIHSKRSN